MVCFDKMDYVASMNNLQDLKNLPNFKVGATPGCAKAHIVAVYNGGRH